MQRGTGGMGNFFGFGDPFAGLGGFGGSSGSLFSSFLDGRDPFSDPFFTNPFGSMLGLNTFGTAFGNATLDSVAQPFGHLTNAGYVEDQAPQLKKSKGPIIREITSDDEEDVGEVNDKGKKEGSRKHLRSVQGPSYIQDPDDVNEKRRKHVHHENTSLSSSYWQPRTHTYTFQSTKVTYGGPNGAYYTSSTTRKTGDDGVTFEENKEADTTTGKATHRISRGLYDKGHSVTRRLASNGSVDTMQTLHNLEEDELPGFEKAWLGKGRLYGWDQSPDMLENGNLMRKSSSSSSRGSRGQGWALPSVEKQPHQTPNRRAAFSDPSNRRV